MTPDLAPPPTAVAELDRRSHWREAQSMLDLLNLALLLICPLEDLLRRWDDYVRYLREGPRRRRLQTDLFGQCLFSYG